MLNVGAVIDHLERLCPPRLAADWDNVGLLLGDRAGAVGRIMTCLTLTPEVTAEAVERRVDLIVTHHPILFRATKRFNADTPDGRMILQLARAGVSVYSPHTAFDNATEGINAQLARSLGLTDVVPLRRGAGAKQVKLVVFVPDKDLAKVSDAVFAAGAGRIGEYSECSYRLSGTGTFFGSDATNPTVGEKGRREEVSEWRLEVVCPESLTGAVVAAMRQAHSYEEPAYDVYPLAPAPGKAGSGRVGMLPAPAPLGQLAAAVRQALGSGPVQVVGDPDRPVRRVAVACGAAGSLLGEAVRARAEAFLTGEMSFHDCQAARAQGVGLVLPGHYATERCGVEELVDRIKGEFPALEVWASRAERDPVGWA